MARLSFRCSDELLASVDHKRGLIPRETWLRMAVSAAVESEAERREDLLEAGSRFLAETPPAPIERLERPLSRTEMFRRATQKR